MSQLIRPIINAFEFGSRLGSVALGDLEQKDAVHRLKKGKGSSIAFLAGHVIAGRYSALQLAGDADENPYAELFGGNVDSRDGDEYPHISELKDEWDRLAVRLPAVLGGLGDEQVLAPPNTDKYPITDNSLRGALGFLAFHESYHIGQIGLLRTELGYASVQHRYYEAAKKAAEKSAKAPSRS